jgi:hypothetical protein
MNGLNEGEMNQKKEYTVRIMRMRMTQLKNEINEEIGIAKCQFKFATFSLLNSH